jgi:glutamate racemase
MKIGVFDSGIGGKSIADRLTADFPLEEIIYVNDQKHVPYGSRSQEEIVTLTDAAIQPLFTAGCSIIVLACNTATAAAIEVLRAKYPLIHFVGLEPMVKTAVALTNSGTIAICATPATLRSERYAGLKEKFASGITVLEPDCSDWAAMIEHNEVEDRVITAIVDLVCKQGADVIVLACTHYHWIEELITAAATHRAVVIDPSDAISKRVATIIKAL